MEMGGAQPSGFICLLKQALEGIVEWKGPKLGLNLVTQTRALQPDQRVLLVS